MSHQVVAVHSVHWTMKPGVAKTDTAKAKPPEAKVYKPGTTFVIDDEDEYNRLIAKGAVRDWGSQAKPQMINDKPVRQADAGVNLDNEDDDAPSAKGGAKKAAKTGGRIAARSKTGGPKTGAGDLI